MSEIVWNVFLFCAILQSILHYRGVSGSDRCVIDVNRDLDQGNEPVLLRRGTLGYELVGPDFVVSRGGLLKAHRRTGVISVSGENQLFVACPGYKNSVVKFGVSRKFAPFVCHTSLKRKLMMSKPVRCSQPPATRVRDTGQQCGPGANIYEVGYSINPETSSDFKRHLKFKKWYQVQFVKNVKKAWQEGKSSFHRVFSCCYDPVRVRTLYAVNVLEGSKVAGVQVGQKEPPYILGQASLYPPGFNVHTKYSLRNQQEVLKQLVGQRRAEEMLNSSSLVRGHLASAQDFLMGTWQASSFNYINVVPQWSTPRPWFGLEDALRTLADGMQTNLFITTGTYGIQQVVDESNKSRELYLDFTRQILPVPEFLWKLVYSPVESSCVAFILSNHHPRESHPRPSICRELGWLQDLSGPWTDRLSCCSYQELRAMVEYVPPHPCDKVLDHQVTGSTTTSSWFRDKVVPIIHKMIARKY